MNFYAIELDLIQAASLFFLVYAISVLISRPFTGRLIDKKGANYVMYPAFVLLASGLFLLGNAESSLTFLMAASLIGFGFGNMQSCTQAIAVKITPMHRMGMATSTFFIFLDAGLGFGPYLLGLLLLQVPFSTMYMLLGEWLLRLSFCTMQYTEEGTNATSIPSSYCEWCGNLL